MMIHHFGLAVLETGLLFLIGFVVEAFAIADEKNTARNLIFNMAATFFFLIASFTFGSALMQTITSLSATIQFRIPFPPVASWRAALVAAILWLIVRDFFYYWFHRLQHRSKWLWAEHELHHSDEHVNVTTASRHHWLEPALDAIFVSVPVFVLFQPPVKASAIIYLIGATFGGFIHLNSKIHLGPLNRLLANPSTHRIHHSKSPEHLDKNFAAFFPIWDVIFGTYFEPQKGICPETGLISGKRISLRQAIALPIPDSQAVVLIPNSAAFTPDCVQPEPVLGSVSKKP